MWGLSRGSLQVFDNSLNNVRRCSISTQRGRAESHTNLTGPPDKDVTHSFGGCEPATPRWRRRRGRGGGAEEGEGGGHPGVTAPPPPPGEGGNYPARTGNWCAFVQRRVVSTAIACGTEKYTIKSQSPCPNGTPDCQLVMYKLSTRPVYREKQKIFTALLWRCCPGHGGDNCEDIVSHAQLDSANSALTGGSGPGSTELRAPARFQQQRGDPDREQNDHQVSVHSPYDTGHAHNVRDNRTASHRDPGHGHDTQDRDPGHGHDTQDRDPGHGHDTQDRDPGHGHNTQDRDPGHAGNTQDRDPGHAHRTQDQDPGHANRTQDRDPGHSHNAQDRDPGHAHRTQDRDPGHAHNAQDWEPGHTHNTQDRDPGHAHNSQDRGHAHNSQDRGHAHNSQDRGHAHNPYPHHRQQEDDFHSPDEVEAGALPYPDRPSALPLPHMMALVMSQLQPVLEGFNRSLEHLSRQVGELSRDVAQLRSNQPGAEPGAEPAPKGDALRGLELREEGAELDETFKHIEEVRRQLESHRADMEDRLHSQHAMLHYNLTSFKTDIDMKLKRNQKMLQVSLQAMNATLAEMKLDQEQMAEDLQIGQAEDHLSPPGTPPPSPAHPPPSLPPPWPQQPQQPLDASALWDAIERLDNTVVNNTVTVNGLVEDVDVTLGNIQELRREFKGLEERIAQTGRNSQIQFMETGLEVEAAKVTVLTRVNELAGNLSQQGQRLQEMDSDVDYLYTAFYKNSNSSGDCDCKVLKAAISQLEQGVANVTELANENRLALDGSSDAGGWDEASDWEPAVEALQHGLQQVKESLAFEQSQTRTMHHNLTQLSGSVAGVLAEVSSLQEADRRLMVEMRHLSSSFASLLKDAIRHSDVLELLLGEEVLEFMEWPILDQEAHSIPVLKEQLQHLQEQLSAHKLDSLQGDRQGSREEVPAADQPSSSSSHLPDDWLPGGLTRRSGGPARERQLLHPEGRRLDYGGDGGDLWSLEKTVEELGVKVRRLEEKPCPAGCNNSNNNKEAAPGGVEAKLQAEVMWLRRGLEEHLRVFKNVFINAEVLAGSDATLDLDKLWNLVKNKDGKREKRKGAETKRGGTEGSNGRGNLRSRRDTSGDVPVLPKLVENPLLFLAASQQNVQDSGFFVLEASLNRGQVYSHTGSFTAPVNGTYLFVLTLDLSPGPAHVGLRRKSGGALACLHREEVTEAGPVTRLGLLVLREGEEVQLELREGTLVNSRDNVFAGLLLHQAT
ncbi:multimerin-2a [Centroberyx gerrardi]